MADANDPLLTPGSRVTVIQQTPRLVGVWTNRTTGTIVRIEQAATRWPFAHARHDRLWLDRLWLQKDDGELIALNLDQYTRIEPAEPTAAEDAEAGPASAGDPSADASDTPDTPTKQPS